MSNDIAKALKQKTDAMLRLQGQSQKPIVYENPDGTHYAPEQADYSAALAQGKNIIITTSGNIKTIEAVMNLLKGDNITISAPDENGAVTISGTISGKGINITDFEGKDGYVLSYNATTDKFELTEVAGGVSTSFVSLTDAPKSYTGQKNKMLTVNETEDALKFTAPFVPSINSSLIEDFEGPSKIPYTSPNWKNVAGGYNSDNCIQMPAIYPTYLTDFDITFTLDCKADGVLSFMYKINREHQTGYGYIFKLDAVTLIENTVNKDWTKFETAITKGVHTLYIRASSYTYSWSVVSLDNLSIPSGKIYSQAIDEHAKIGPISDNPNKLLATKADGSGIEYIDKPMLSLPQAAETVLGGVKAKTKTTETSEIVIDPATGKLYGPSPDAAANGLPQGGTAGQILSKIDGVDYNTKWINAPSGGASGTLVDLNLIALLNPIWTPSIDSKAFNGNISASDYFNVGSGTREFVADFGISIPISKVVMWMFYGDGRSYRGIGLYGSIDNVNWTIIRTPSDVVFTAAGLIIPIATNYRYLKFHMEANATYNSNDLVEIKIFGKLALQ